LHTVHTVFPINQKKKLRKLAISLLPAIVKTGIKRKANISLYDDFQIPNSNIKGTNYNVKKQMY
ncbi:33593_t:CDS:2, partial [Racocetra persica]